MAHGHPMLSQTSEHALRAILLLARRAADAPLRAEVIAMELGTPRNYLAKTLGSLARRGLVSSARGPFGGFRLAVAPETLTIAEVVSAFEPRPPSVCRVGGRWSEVAAEMWAPLNDTTIADLLAEEGPDHTTAGASAGTPCPTALVAAG